jgi:hypothetical protein
LLFVWNNKLQHSTHKKKAGKIADYIVSRGESNGRVRIYIEQNRHILSAVSQDHSIPDEERAVVFPFAMNLDVIRVMYGFKKPKLEFPIQRAHIDFWSVGFRRCVRGPTKINPQPPMQPPRNIVMAWTIESDHMFGVS